MSVENVTVQVNQKVTAIVSEINLIVGVSAVEHQKKTIVVYVMDQVNQRVIVIVRVMSMIVQASAVV